MIASVMLLLYNSSIHKKINTKQVSDIPDTLWPNVLFIFALLVQIDPEEVHSHYKSSGNWLAKSN